MRFRRFRAPVSSVPAQRRAHAVSSKAQFDSPSRNFSHHPLLRRTTMPSLDEKIGAVSQRLLGLDSGPLAELRRMEPGGRGTPIFWRLAAEHGFGEGETTQRWMQIVRILAILTPRSHMNPAARLHDRFRQLGRVLCDGGNQAWPSDPKNPRPALSETRFARLLATPAA